MSLRERRLSAATGYEINLTNMGLQVVNAYIYALDHVQEVPLEYKGFSRVIQHTGCLFKLLEVL